MHFTTSPLIYELPVNSRIDSASTFVAFTRSSMEQYSSTSDAIDVLLIVGAGARGKRGGVAEHFLHRAF